MVNEQRSKYIKEIIKYVRFLIADAKRAIDNDWSKGFTDGEALTDFYESAKDYPQTRLELEKVKKKYQMALMNLSKLAGGTPELHDQIFTEKWEDEYYG